jgi:hypothetical protein
MEQISGMPLVISLSLFTHLPRRKPLCRKRKHSDHQERVLKDASMMIPRTKVNLERAVEELDDLVVSLLPLLLTKEQGEQWPNGRMHLRVMRRSRGVKSLKLLPIN